MTKRGKKGGIDLTAFTTNPPGPESFATWVKVHDRVREGEMPPKKREQPAADEKTAFLKALDAQLHALSAAAQARDGAAIEAGASVFQCTMVLYGSNVGNASSHNTQNLPVLLFGGGFRHGQHLAFDAKNNAPLGRLFVSMLQQLGLEESQFAHATGALSGLERA